MFIALLDTSVLWPSLQRNFLLSLAIEHVYRPVWSAAILAELEHHEALKLHNRGTPVNEAQARAARLVAQIAGAGVIVTANLKDFPAKLLPDGIEAIPVTEFARDAVSLSPAQSFAAITQIAKRSGKTGPQQSELDIVEVLEQRYGMTEAMAMVRAELTT